MVYRFLLTYLCVALSVSAFATPAFGQEIQSVGPIKTYTNWLPEEKFFKPSIKKKLPAGYRVDIPFFIIDGTVVIQRPSGSAPRHSTARWLAPVRSWSVSAAPRSIPVST